MNRVVLFALSMIPLACGSTDDADPEAADGALMDAAPTREHPEVGFWVLRGAAHGCTGTLIAPRVVLTAAHCADFRRAAVGTDIEPLGKFGVEDAAGGLLDTFDIDGIESFGSDLFHTSDVALLHLAAAVPPRLATPALVARAEPASSDDAWLIGYGCTDRDDESLGRGQKRAAAVRIGEPSRRLCPWDSGGPTLLRATRTVVRVSSYFERRGEDHFAPVWPVASAIAAQIARWERAEGEPAGQTEI